jgi:hypothetical protein
MAARPAPSEPATSMPVGPGRRPRPVLWLALGLIARVQAA